ncbi:MULTISPECIES: sulfite exporter TauE/SafE family protein [unclassified Haladaptatus]|uniref:sulfite exporter TauE/SafE family protein n=1 Tax=unclassified Haladaptatus TaxID=2622732 RepID=UPI00209C1172|nr:MULTISPECIES: sulfite exporter TauE/SafE family protein [unclassified Haladaptatus]MCO8242877.1 sulfite exporter TauE/SafE family protein [Haladaptatus sp. AB643]MCO8252637.1 sulfite exporter TauE/SafE family protein [Haladaptatus sp. AB618]
MSLPLGFSPTGLGVFVLLTFLIATTVNTFAMEAAVLFTPAFLFVYPELVPAFPDLALQGAIGLALFVELFGYTSSVSAYWFRGQVDWTVAKSILLVSIPIAILARAVSYFVPSTALKLLFGGMLLVLSTVLYLSHRDGKSLGDLVDESRLSGVLSRDSNRIRTDGGARTPRFDRFDRTIAGVGGAMAGLVGIAIGELAQTLLTVRKNVSIRISTGTSALILHGTVVSALVANLVLLRYAPESLSGHNFTVPFEYGLVAGVTCAVGGQMGAFLNSRVPEHRTVQTMMVVYSLVGIFTLVRVFALG